MKIDLQGIQNFTLSKEVVLFDFIRNWEEKVKPHLTSSEITEALKEGFSDHFLSEEEIEEYPWDDPRLDSFGAIGFGELHEIMDEESFKNYIGEEYDLYFETMDKRFEEEDNDEWFERDWVKERSYFAYRALSRCHHLAPFYVALGKKMYPEYTWYHFEMPAHANAIGVKDGKICMVLDLLWGELHDNPKTLVGEMFDHSIRILKHQFKEEASEEQLAVIEKGFSIVKEKVLEN